jgi:hypothetical protein
VTQPIGIRHFIAANIRAAKRYLSNECGHAGVAGVAAINFEKREITLVATELPVQALTPAQALMSPVQALTLEEVFWMTEAAQQLADARGGRRFQTCL